VTVLIFIFEAENDEIKAIFSLGTQIHF